MRRARNWVHRPAAIIDRRIANDFDTSGVGIIGFFRSMWCFALASHTGACALRPTDQDQKQALGDPRLGQVFFRKVVLALPCRTVDHGNVLRFGITANATAETGRPAASGILLRKLATALFDEGLR